MENLTELRDRVLTLPTLENRMTLLKNEIRKAEAEIAGLLQRYEQEHRDVERIQKESLSSFMLKIIGKYEDKLEKERREEIEAKLAYDRAVTRCDSLTREKEELASRISVLRVEERNYQTELAARRRSLADKLTEPEGARYTELENERRAIVSQITEIKEALSAAARAKATAQSALKSLESAEGWATYDAFTRGGIISHMAKYSHIDSAEQGFHKLSSQLRDLKSELSDVRGLTSSGLSEISSFQRTVDFWFDNIFTDLSVRGQIKDNAGEIRRLLSGINAAESALKTRLQAEETRLTENSRREEELLVSLK